MFDLLVKYIADEDDVPMKTLIDKVRKDAGRDPAREPTRLLSKYWIITPPGSVVDSTGNTSKIRHVQEGSLNKSQIRII